MAMTLLIGGARAGKSEHAVRLASASNAPVVFIATAQASDDEMAERIRRHRARRPSGWKTIEEPLEIGKALDAAEAGSTVVIDCLTLWVSNLMLDCLDTEQIFELAAATSDLAAERAGTTIVVTNEVGAGVHPPTELGRRFQDALGRVNAIWSERAAEAFLVVAGRVLELTAASEPMPRP